MTPRHCGVSGCGRATIARGLCKSHYNADRRRRSRVELVCSWCGTTFLGGDEGKSGRRYCKVEHEAEAKAARARAEAAARPPLSPSSTIGYRRCAVCDDTFVVRPHGERRRFCSDRCLWASRFGARLRPCTECGTSVVLTEKQRFCSSACCRRWSKRHRARGKSRGISVEQIGRRDSRRGPGRIPAQLLLEIEVAS